MSISELRRLEHFRPPTKRTHSRDIVRHAVNAGRRLPLQIMLENMWWFIDRAELLERSVDETTGLSDNSDVLQARQYRLAAQKCALEAAPFCHPKLMAVTVAEATGEQVEHAKRAVDLISDWSSKSDDEVRRAYQDLIAGRKAAVED